jgi:hypothetical protein
LTFRIQTGAIDDVHKAISKENDPEKQEEGKRITQGLATLKYELQHDRKLTYVGTNSRLTHLLTFATQASGR